VALDLHANAHARRTIPDRPLYTSDGYLVLTPDIVYSEGQPGQSALKCVLPAIDALVARGIVDEARIGIQGHSWGGYQLPTWSRRPTASVRSRPARPSGI
jgi:dienelactone hydrolase